MTILVKEYTSKSGTIYQLKEFDKTRIYHSNEVRSTKANNAEYWEAIAKDKKLEQIQEAESKKVKPLTDDERFAIAVANKKRQDDERAAYEARELAKVKQHQDYLASSPDVAEVATTNFLTFITECHVWLSKNYTLIDSTLTSTPSGFNMVVFEAPKAKKK